MNKHNLLLALLVFNVGCFNKANVNTIGSLADKPLTLEIVSNNSVPDQRVITSYESFLDIAQPGPLHSDALRRLADLKLEASIKNNMQADDKAILKSEAEASAAITLYQSYIKNYPNSPTNELILYQLSKAYSLTGDTENALDSMSELARQFPDSQYMAEIQFRIGEIYFSDNDYVLSEAAYKIIVDNYKDSIFYEKARYKYAWSLFKQNNYTDAVDNFLILLKQIKLQKHIEGDTLSETLPRAEKELITDTLRVVSIALSYQDGAQSLATYISNHRIKAYEPLLYKQLGDLYLNKERILDAANTNIAFTMRNPNAAISPKFHTSAINAYHQGGFPTLELEAKESFANRYKIGGSFWNTQNSDGQSYLRPLLAKHLLDLARHYHASAKKSGRPSDYQIASIWYKTYLKDFSSEKNGAYINFLLAETLFDAGDYKQAINEYEITSYNYQPHNKSAEAGYAALLAYKKLLDKTKTNPKSHNQIKLASLDSALNFSASYPDDKRTSSVLAKTAEEHFKINNYQTASTVANQLMARRPGKKHLITAYTVHAHSAFELNNYKESELSYKKLLSLLPTKSPKRKALTDKMAACIYKQGETYQTRGQFELAANEFLRISKVAPESGLRMTAEYDAAAIYIQQKQWKKSIHLLERFRKHYPGKTKLQQGVTEKLALAYTESSNHPKAARELLLIADNSNNKQYKNELKLQAADHYIKANNQKKAIPLYISIVKSRSQPFHESIELQNRIATYYKNQKQTKKWHYWLKEIVKANNNARKSRTDHTNLLAANAELVLLQPQFNAYKRVQLKIPLKKSLKTKKVLMEKVIKSYEGIIRYQLADTTTAAAYNIGEAYQHFAHALIESQRPKGLSEEELEQYEILLEEQAFPFEEKAISIHEANIKQTSQGIYNQWIKNSIKTLSEILPVRYAKQERIDSYVEVIY